jgi:hypothetical protein
LHAEWVALKKNRTRTSGKQELNQQKFEEKLDDLFDVAHANAFLLMTNQEDIDFLKLQRKKGRPGHMVSVDMALHRREERSISRREKEAERAQKEQMRKTKQDECNPNQNCDDCQQQVQAEDHNDEFCPPVSKRRRSENKKGAKKLITPQVASALDRTNTSNRKGTYIAASVLRAVGKDPTDYALSHESIRRARKENRFTTAEFIKQSFSPNVPLTVHWDGKLMSSLNKSKAMQEKVDRLAILVSGDSIMKLLAVPALSNGTGKEQQEAVTKALDEWGIRDRVIAMSFDTTSSNTGSKNGACIHIEAELGRRLLHLACRHHIHELVIGQAFSILLPEVSKGPNIMLFQKFAQEWPRIDKSKILGMPKSEPHLSNEENEEIRQLDEVQPRGDYLEVLKLALAFLGDD